MHKASKGIWLFGVISSLVTGLIAVVPFLFEYKQLKPLGDAISKDGNLESFTLSIYQAARWPAIILGWLLIALGIVAIAKRDQVRSAIGRSLRWIQMMLKRVKPDAQDFWRDFARSLPKKWEMAALLSILGAALLARILFIDLPIDYDEAYTFTEFAQHSFRQVISDYHVPNNHVFQTILVRISFLIFGAAPWALRIPVVLAGLALVPATYVLARQLYDPEKGLISASLVASSPALIIFSVTARGYMLVTLFTILTLILGLYVSRHKNLFAWAWLILFTALGFYSIPIMLYPFGVLVTWLVLLGVKKEISSEYKGVVHWIKYLAVASIAAGAITILLYSPILFTNGIFNFFNGARVVNSIPIGIFLEGLPGKIKDVLFTWRDWHFNTPRAVEYILMPGVLFSLIFHRRISNVRTALQAAFFTALITLLLIQRPNSIARIWLWTLPLFLIWAAAGWMALIEQLFRLGTRTYKLRIVFAGLCIVVALGGSLWLGWNKSPKYGHPYSGKEAEAVARYLNDHITPDDVIVPSKGSDANYWYYGRYVEIPNVNFRAIKSRPFSRAYVIVYPANGDTIESVILESGPDLVFFDLKSAKLVFTDQNAEVYSVDAFPEIIKKAYDLK